MWKFGSDLIAKLENRLLYRSIITYKIKMGKVVGAGEKMTLYSLSLQPVALQRFNQVCYEEKVIPGNVLIDVYLRVSLIFFKC